MAHDLEDQLRAGGAKVAEGTFRVDAGRALAKLREYRLADPHHWVLEVLRAASSSKASKVDIETDTDDIIIRFDSAPFAPEVMKDLLAQALDSKGHANDRRSARYLSLGVAGALGLEPKWIKISSGEVALEIVPPNNVTVGPAKEKGNFVHVRKRFGWNVIKAALFDVSPEELAVADRARRYGPTLTVNRKRITAGPVIKGGFVVSSTFGDSKIQVEVGVPVSGKGGTLVLDIDGIVVARREYALPGRHLVAFARCDTMRRNASGSDVVDSDAAVKATLAKVRELALDATQKMGVLIAEGKAKKVWRERYRAYALECFENPRLDAEALPLLEKFPLIPGLYDEWHSPWEFEQEAKAGRPVYYCLSDFPRGSYPTPIARVDAIETDPIAKLLPAKGLTNAAKVVRARARAAQAKHRWLSSPIEEPVPTMAGVIARAALSGSGIKGELGLVDKINAGAFVRLLCKGRFVQEGEVSTLSPLRVRATVNWEKDVPERLWTEIPSDKLWSMVLESIETAAEEAVLTGLNGEEPLRFSGHAHDLLIRKVTSGVFLGKLPLQLRSAEIFELTGGGQISLDALAKVKTWRWVGASSSTTLLSGDPVLVLTPELRPVLAKLAPRELEDARERFEQERDIRNRLSQPKIPALLSSVQVVVDLKGEGITGQIGIPKQADSGLGLTLLRDGVLLEKTSLTANYGLAQAIVECKDFAPNADWDTAVRDATFDRALAAVRAGEETLVGALIDRSPGALDSQPEGHRQFLVQYLRKHFRGPGMRSVLEEKVENAPLFRTQDGVISLAGIRERLNGEKRLWTVMNTSMRAPKSMFVLLIEPGQAGLFSDLLDVRVESATPELEKIDRRERYLARPEWVATLPGEVTLSVPIDEPGVKGTIGFVPGDDRATRVDVIVCGRFFVREQFASRLPLFAALELGDVDPAQETLPQTARAAITSAIAQAERGLLRLATAESDTPAGQTVALLALQHRVETNVKQDVAQGLLKLELFPCTDGRARSALAFDDKKRVPYVIRQIAGEPSSKEPVIVAVHPQVKRALGRWSSEDVTEALELELGARAQRARISPVKAVAFSRPTLWVRKLEGAQLEGELAIVSDFGGRLELLHERKPLSVIDGALPAPLAAIVNCDTLTLASFSTAVARDEKYDALLEQLAEEAELLLDHVAGVVFSAGEDERWRLAPLLAPMAFWLAGRKKRSARLVKVPLFRTTGERAISLYELLQAQKKDKKIPWSDEPGTPLEDERWIWRPREGEKAALQQIQKVSLVDATASILRAAEIRARKVVTDLSVPGSFRETLASDRVQGELALPERPSKTLAIELHRNRMHLEHFGAEHPVGVIGRINCDRLTANNDWTRAHRNLAFKQVMAEVEDVIERLLARRLGETSDPGWRAFAEAALKWKRAPGGPLAEAIGRMELFTTLGGAPVTVGAAREEHARNGRLLIAEPGLPPPTDRVVLARSEDTVALLDALELKNEDTSALLKRSAELEKGLKARRLKSLEYPGASIARLKLDADGLRGELVLVSPGSKAEITLARDGIRVCAHALELPISGVVNVEGLEVNDDWTKAVVSRELRQKLNEAGDLLFATLATRVPDLSTDERHQARDLALRFLSSMGVASAIHLERMKGAAAELAKAPLLLSEAGEWVSISAVADQVLRRGWVSVFDKKWLRRETFDELVLRADSLRESWITALEKLFGASCVERVFDVEVWRKQLSERDPAPGTPEGAGLRLLRKQMRLLRAGALGHVTPDELDDVRLRAEGAKAPITYDQKRKLALLDTSDPKIAKALAEIPTRPERLYVLLAAIYGAVNRALARITDDDESELLTALAAHLAANPKSLAPTEPE